jgi:hypothetical protein
MWKRGQFNWQVLQELLVGEFEVARRLPNNAMSSQGHANMVDFAAAIDCLNPVDDFQRDETGVQFIKQLKAPIASRRAPSLAGDASHCQREDWVLITPRSESFGAPWGSGRSTSWVKVKCPAWRVDLQQPCRGSRDPCRGSRLLRARHVDDCNLCPCGVGLHPSLEEGEARHYRPLCSGSRLSSLPGRRASRSFLSIDPDC